MANYRSHWSYTTALLVTLFLLAGCGSGSDGAPGPEGPEGPPGPGGGGGAPVADAEKINVKIDGVTVQPGGVDTTVSFTLTNDQNLGLTGLPAGNISFVLSQLSPGINNGSSEWQSYVTRNDGGVTDAQATYENGAVGEFTDNGDGTYTYTFANALPDYPAGPAYDETKTHRIGVEIRFNGIPANNAPTDFLPTGGAPLFNRLIVDNDTCNACHDNLEMHGDARFDVEYCMTCHNPSSIDGNTGNTVDMKRLTHIIHAGRPDYTIIGYGGREHNWADVVFPQDLRNCQTCHDETDDSTPQAEQWRTVANRASCGTCHYDDGIPDSGHDYAIEDGFHPGGSGTSIQYADDMQCIDCHGPTGTVLNDEGRLVQTPVAHEIREQTAGEEFEFNIISVTNTMPGDLTTVRFSVTNPNGTDDPSDDTFYDIHADEPFIQCPFPARESRLAIDIGWSTTEYANIGSGEFPGLPITLDVLRTACGGDATNIGGNIFEATSTTPIPLDATGSLAVVLEGHPGVDVYDNGEYLSIAVKTAVFYAPITDVSSSTGLPKAKERRDVVDIDKCSDCHQELALHGSNRTDEPQACVVCHNPMVTDINRRTAASGSCAPGTDDQGVDFKRMIHQIHATGELGTTFDVCGFGGRPVSLEAEYPGRLNNCEGCHLPGTYYPDDPFDTTVVFGTTISANDPAILTDDVVYSPNYAVCSACHADSLAYDHMMREGGDDNARKAADGTLISAQDEGCVICHGPGRTADVKVVHEIETFDFN